MLFRFIFLLIFSLFCNSALCVVSDPTLAMEQLTGQMAHTASRIEQMKRDERRHTSVFDIPFGEDSSHAPQDVQRALRAIWRLDLPKGSAGAVFISPTLALTAFSNLNTANSIEDISLTKGSGSSLKKRSIKGIEEVSAVYNLALISVESPVEDFLTAARMDRAPNQNIYLYSAIDKRLYSKIEGETITLKDIDAEFTPKWAYWVFPMLRIKSSKNSNNGYQTPSFFHVMKDGGYRFLVNYYHRGGMLGSPLINEKGEIIGWPAEFTGNHLSAYPAKLLSSFLHYAGAAPARDEGALLQSANLNTANLELKMIRDLAHTDLADKAQKGLAEAQYRLSLQMRADNNTQGSLYWLRQAIQSGHLLAHIDYIRYFFDEKEEGRPAENLIEWLDKAKELGDPMLSLFYRAEMYRKGIAVPKDMNKALSAHEGLAHLGHAASQYILAHHYYYDGALNPDKALFWLNKAVSAGFPAALYLKADIYENGGLGIPQNKDKALIYYALAADRGHRISQDKIALDLPYRLQPFNQNQKTLYELAVAFISQREEAIQNLMSIRSFSLESMTSTASHLMKIESLLGQLLRGVESSIEIIAKRQKEGMTFFLPEGGQQETLKEELEGLKRQIARALFYSPSELLNNRAELASLAGEIERIYQLDKILSVPMAQVFPDAYDMQLFVKHVTQFSKSADQLPSQEELASLPSFVDRCKGAVKWVRSRREMRIRSALQE